MPSDWAQRVRQLGDNPGARDTVARIRSRAVASNPFTSGALPQPPVAGAPPVGVYDPFAAAAAPPLANGHNPFTTPAPPHAASAFTVGPAASAPLVGSGTPVGALVRPTAVKVAAWALLAAAVLTLGIGGMGAYAIAELRTTVGHVLELDQSGAANLLASGYADDTQVILMVGSVAVAAVVSVAYLLVTRSIWSGRSWPRTVCPFLVLLSIPAIFIGPLATSIVLAGAVATAAAWTPSARAYSQQRAASRAASRGRR